MPTFLSFIWLILPQASSPFLVLVQFPPEVASYISMAATKVQQFYYFSGLARVLQGSACYSVTIAREKPEQDQKKEENRMLSLFLTIGGLALGAATLTYIAVKS